MDLKRYLTEKERDELRDLMAVRDPRFVGPMQGSITRVHGFLTSVASGPIVMSSKWIPLVFGDDEDHPWEGMEQAQRALTLLMRFHNEILSDLGPDGRQYGIVVDRIGDDADSDLADSWCIGYTLGFVLHEDAWKEAMEAPELQEAFLPILLMAHKKKAPEIDPDENPQTHAAMLAALPTCALKIYEWWRKKLVASFPSRMERQAFSGTVRRTSPKISPNALCPCGSGKKYKRCCSALRAV
jgi:uncharacterized protein